MTFPPSTQWPVYSGQLGFSLNEKSTTFTLWAPTASCVTLRLFETGNNSEPFKTRDLKPLRDGAWRTSILQRLDGVYYDFLVTFADGKVNRTSDPWGIASGVNGERSLVIDEDRVSPAGWHKDKSPEFVRHATVVWEMHVEDFSSNKNGGFKPEHRGQYLAFTDSHTTLDADSNFPTGIDYLKKLGVTHVQLMPIYDFATVDEVAISSARKSGESVDSLYNWGYDPHAYNVPEGAYSSNPYDGTARIRECKAMIGALHKNGMRVVMDVVYNHMFEAASNAFESVAPGYFCRRKEDGGFANGSGCGNEMASDHPMFRRFMIESILHWVRCYHVDGFRFDLMGLADAQTLNMIRAELDKLDGGKDILMYGEPWGAAAAAVADDCPMGDKAGRGFLDSRIGWFSDESRDTLKGNVMDHRDRGYVNGNEFWTADPVRNAFNGWRGMPCAGKSVGQIVQYVSAHDDLTLWDKLCISMRDNASSCDFDASDPNSVADIFSANILSAGIILCSAGMPFMLGGEEFGRTKHGCDNSYNRGVAMNQLDWSRAKRFQPLVDWYSALIKLRAKNAEFYDAQHTRLTASDNSVLAEQIGSDLIVCANPMKDASATVDLPESCASRKKWRCVLDSSEYFDRWIGSASSSRASMLCDDNGDQRAVHIPPRTFVVLSNKRA